MLKSAGRRKQRVGAPDALHSLYSCLVYACGCQNPEHRHLQPQGVGGARGQPAYNRSASTAGQAGPRGEFKCTRQGCSQILRAPLNVQRLRYCTCYRAGQLCALEQGSCNGPAAASRFSPAQVPRHQWPMPRQMLAAMPRGMSPWCAWIHSARSPAHSVGSGCRRAAQGCNGGRLRDEGIGLLCGAACRRNASQRSGHVSTQHNAHQQQPH